LLILCCAAHNHQQKRFEWPWGIKNETSPRHDKRNMHVVVSLIVMLNSLQTTGSFVFMALRIGDNHKACFVLTIA